MDGFGRTFWYMPPLLLFGFASVCFGNPAHEELMRRSEAQRQQFFAVFLRSGGETCHTVTRTFYQGLHRNGAAFWSVACAGGQSYQVMINNDAAGSTKV